MNLPDEITPTEALGLIHELSSSEWKLHHIPTKSTWSGEQVKVAVGAVTNLRIGSVPEVSRAHLAHHQTSGGSKP